jgi:hypothetical protein
MIYNLFSSLPFPVASKMVLISCFYRHVYVAIWVWVINLQDTFNAMYIGVKTRRQGS